MTVLHDTPPVSRFRIPAADAAVPQARRAVGEIAGSWGLDPRHDLAYTLRLVVTELVTNAVRHAGVCSPAIDVVVCLTRDGWLQVGVHDRHPFRPKALLEVVDHDSGRGLLIVKHLVGECGGRSGIEPDEDAGGKTVWIALPMPPP